MEASVLLFPSLPRTSRDPNRMDSVYRLSKSLINLNSLKNTFGVREIHVSPRLRGWRNVKKCRIALVGLGGVGQSLAHLLKMYPAGFSELRLCNRSDPAGIVQELTHIPTGVKVSGFKGYDELADGLRDAEVVVLAAGVPRKKNAPREKLFLENAQLCKEIIERVADNCPEALIAVVSNPLDSLVPVAAEVLKQRAVYRPSKLFGICELDSMRSRHYYAEAICRESSETYVPVVGGHSEDTTVPLFSQARPRVSLSHHKMAELTTKVREAGKRIVSAKKGTGGSTWSMASGALSFVHQLYRALNHEPHVITSAFVQSDATESSFFSNQFLLGPDGVEKNFGCGKVTEFEAKLIDDAVKILRQNIIRAQDFARNHESAESTNKYEKE